MRSLRRVCLARAARRCWVWWRALCTCTCAHSWRRTPDISTRSQLRCHAPVPLALRQLTTLRGDKFTGRQVSGLTILPGHAG